MKGTFFTLGWIAERNPAIVREIVEGGHELASHGYCHYRVDSQSPEEFRADIRRTKIILEDIGGVEVNGYRAATFSVGASTPWAWPVLEEEGYRYSSSVYPVERDNYSNPDAPRSVYQAGGRKDLIEVPIATVRIGAKNYPAAAAAISVFCPMPSRGRRSGASTAAIRPPAVFYIHPWEVDPGQPRANGMSAKSRFRHYTNLAKTGDRLAPSDPRFPLGPHGFHFPRRNHRSGRRTRPAMLLPDTKEAAAEWDRFVASRPMSTFFHLSGWRECHQAQLRPCLLPI